MACCPVLLPVCPVLSAVVQAAARSGSGGGGLVAGRRMRRGRALPAVARPPGSEVPAVTGRLDALDDPDYPPTPPGGPPRS